MANEISKTPPQANPQVVPLSKIHDLPGVFNPKPQDKALGSMVLSIESSGVKEAVILRQRDDGEYQLLSGYRRRRASELAKKLDIPAHVYEMTMQETIAYRKAVKQNPNAPKKGEKGIMILAPCNFRASLERDKIDPLTGRTLYGPDGQPLTEKVKISPNRFKVAHVFDLSQTEGRELPQIGVSELSGDVENFAGIYDRLTALSPCRSCKRIFNEAQRATRVSRRIGLSSSLE